VSRAYCPCERDSDRSRGRGKEPWVDMSFSLPLRLSICLSLLYASPFCTRAFCVSQSIAHIFSLAFSFLSILSLTCNVVFISVAVSYFLFLFLVLFLSRPILLSFAHFRSLLHAVARATSCSLCSLSVAHKQTQHTGLENFFTLSCARAFLRFLSFSFSLTHRKHTY